MSDRASIETIADWRPFVAGQSIREIAATRHEIAVLWSDGRRSPFHVDWLRDNCPCAGCLHRLTREQMFEIVDAPADLGIEAATIDRDGALAVRWGDGHDSRYAAGWLRVNAYDDASRAERGAAEPPTLWDAAATVPRAAYSQLMADNLALLDWLITLRDRGLVLVGGVPTAPATVATLARRISFVRETNFGVIFDVASKPRPDSAAYTSVNLPPHTDLPTRELQPGLQFLHCLVNEAAGGESIFVDGFAVADALAREAPEDFALLTTVPVAFWNKDDRTDYRFSAPVIALDPVTGKVAELRCANFLRGPLDAPAEVVAPFYRAYRRFQAMTRDPRFRVVHRLEAGEMWVFDNRRVLHARAEFDPMSGARHLQGCYVDRDELLSRIRVLARGGPAGDA
jgi:gamma-butyrobetaine dioxygenase